MKAKALMIMAAALPLSACNMVVSDTPWFAEASGPQFKDGLWANLRSPDCAVDPAAAIDAWPACASPMLVEGNSYAGPPSGRDPATAAARNDPAKWERLPHVLVAGDPQIDQILFVIREGGPIKLENGKKEQPIYLYIAVRPLARDGEGRITEAQRWLVMCGPLPKKPTGKNQLSAFTSDRPFNGIRIEKDNCVAESVEALRGAAAASEGAAQEAGMTKTSVRWIRPAV